MKKQLHILLAGALLLGACSQDLDETLRPATDSETGCILLSARHAAAVDPDGSRVTITGDRSVWSLNDSISVFAVASKAPARFELTAGAGSENGDFEGKIGAEEGSGIFALYPYVPDTVAIVPTAVKIAFNGQMQNGFGDRAEAHLGRYAYMASAPATLADGKAQLAFSYLAVKMSFEFSLPEEATVRFLTLSTKLAQLYDKGTVDLTAATPVAKPWGTASRTLSMGFENGHVSAGEKVVAHMMMMPVDLSSSEVTFYVSAERPDGTPVTYTMKKSAGLKFAASASYTAEVNSLQKVDTYLPMVYVPGGSLNICGIYSDTLDDYQLLDKDYKVNSFWIAATEVTNQQYCDFLNSRKPAEFQLSAWIATDSEDLMIEQKGGTWVPKNGPILGADGKTVATGSYADYPMIMVTYNGANAYTAWVAEKMCGYSESNYSIGCYLPSEAQWEYAATGSEWNPDCMNHFWAGGNDPDKVMWSNLNCDSEGSSCLGMYVGNGDDPNSIIASGSHNGGTHPVGKLAPNFLGLYDMSGNVSEICADWFHSASFPYGGSLDPRCMDIGAADDYYGDQTRAVRGGLWSTYAIYGWTFTRDAVTATYYGNGTGFRPILPLK